MNIEHYYQRISYDSKSIRTFMFNLLSLLFHLYYATFRTILKQRYYM